MSATDIARANAAFREEFLRRGLATPRELDEAGWVSSGELDLWESAGCLEEGVGGLERLWKEGLHPRGRRGEWVEKPGETKAPKLHIQGVRLSLPHREETSFKAMQKVRKVEGKGQDASRPLARARAQLDKEQVARTGKPSTRTIKTLQRSGHPDFPVFQGRAEAASEAVGHAELRAAGAKRVKRLQKAAHKEARSAQRKGLSAVAAQKHTEADALHAAAQDPGQLAKHGRVELYDQRTKALEKRIRKSVKSAGKEAKTPIANRPRGEHDLAAAEAKFNEAGHIDQSTLLAYAEAAAERPTTAQMYRDKSGNWDPSRQQLHADIIDTFMREVDANGNPSKTAPYIQPPDGPPTVVMTGGGYAPLALDTPIATPSGWTTMGQIAPGDYVFDEHGRPVWVEGVSDVFTGRDCYELEFDDGSKIVADAEHRWITSTLASRKSYKRSTAHGLARDAYAKSRLVREYGGTLAEAAEVAGVAVRTAHRWEQTGGGSKQRDDVRTTAEIAASLTVERGDQTKNNHAIDNPAPLVLPEARLPIDPYTLGAWLGDGTSAGAELTCADDEIPAHIRFAGYDVKLQPWTSGGGCPVWGIRGLRKPLREAGLLGHKHVPAQYLRASEGQRRALLAGLMDTDGHSHSGGICEFTNTNRNLADGVAELLRSLGIKARVTEGRATLDGRDCGPKYRVHFTPDQPVFRLARKREVWTVKDGRRDRVRRRFVVTARKVESVPTRCLAVASKTHLFLAGEAMIPTCNSGKGGIVKMLKQGGQNNPDPSMRWPDHPLVIDPDKIKAQLPEFQATAGDDPEANLRVYSEAWDIAQELVAAAQAKGLNVVVDGITNTSADAVAKKIQSFKDAGYQNPAIQYISMPTQIAMKGAAARAQKAIAEGNLESQRMIPDVIMRAVHRDVSATIPEVMSRAKAMGVHVNVFDGNQGKDEMTGQFRLPKLIASVDPEGHVVHQDSAAYAKVLNKASEKIPGLEKAPEGQPRGVWKTGGLDTTIDPKIERQIGAALVQAMPETDNTMLPVRSDPGQLLTDAKVKGLPALQAMLDMGAGLSEALGAITEDLSTGETSFADVGESVRNNMDQPHVVIGPVKSLRRSLQKLHALGADGDSTFLRDSLRATVTVPTAQDMPDAMAALVKRLEANGWKCERIKNRLVDADGGRRMPITGYGEIGMDWRLPAEDGGMIAEIQVNTNPMWWTKEIGPGHKFYEVERGVRERGLAEQRPLTSDELAIQSAVGSQESMLNDRAWGIALNGGGDPNISRAVMGSSAENARVLGALKDLQAQATKLPPATGGLAPPGRPLVPVPLKPVLGTV